MTVIMNNHHTELSCVQTNQLPISATPQGASQNYQQLLSGLSPASSTNAEIPKHMVCFLRSWGAGQVHVFLSGVVCLFVCLVWFCLFFAVWFSFGGKWLA